MTNDHINENESSAPIPSETDVIKDCDLEKVSGGHYLPSDMCENQFIHGRCVDSFWGNCKYLNSTFVKRDEITVYYKGSCTKGYFQDILYKDYE